MTLTGEKDGKLLELLTAAGDVSRMMHEGEELLPLDVGPVPTTLGTVPLALRLVRQVHAGEVEPFDGTAGIVAADHLPERYLLTHAIGRLVRVQG